MEKKDFDLTKNTIDFLRYVVNRKQVRKEDREKLREIAKEYDVPFKEKNCNNCWIDLAVTIWKKIESTQESTEGKKGRWSVRKNLNVIYQGITVNELTITDELAEKLLQKGFPKHLLVENKDFENGKD